MHDNLRCWCRRIGQLLRRTCRNRKEPLEEADKHPHDRKDDGQEAGQGPLKNTLAAQYPQHGPANEKECGDTRNEYTPLLKVPAFGSFCGLWFLLLL